MGSFRAKKSVLLFKISKSFSAKSDQLFERVLFNVSTAETKLINKLIN